ncbi:MAG: hypothetical protein V4662_19110 [Verrucomicrobiota bacterium]
MATNPTPTNDHQLLILCDHVAEGCAQLEEEIGLATEVAPRVRSRAEAVRERMAEVKRLKPRRTKRRSEFRKLDREGEQVIGRCRLRLAALHGPRFNEGWREAGFPQGTTMVPEAFATRLKVLEGLVRYFQKHPELESLDMKATAEICREMLAGLERDRQAVQESATKLRDAVLAKRSALRALRNCLRDTIRTLSGLLPGDDPRWAGFGLKPPKASHTQPEPVGELSLTPVRGGAVEARWSAALHAETYEIQARLMGASAFKAVKAVRGLEVQLTGWPSGQILEVRIVAANPLGKAAPSPVMALWLT